jgi:hypothetical protein
MSDLFGTDYEGRKAIPIFEGVVMYFPKALAAVAEVSHAGNQQHNPGEPLHWARGKSMDQYNTALRHMMDHRMGGGRLDPQQEGQEINNGWRMETRDKDGVRHLAKAAWRILAALQLTIEEEESGPQLGSLDFEKEFKSVIVPGREQSARAGIRDTSQPLPADVIQKTCKCGARVYAYRKGDLSPQVMDPTGSLHRIDEPCLLVEKDVPRV